MKKPLLVIGNKNYSSWSLHAWLMLKRARADFDEITIPLLVEGYKEKPVSYSPAGKVPVYRDDNLVVGDSIATGEHLYEFYPSLWPAQQADHALARSISEKMHSGFTALRKLMPMNIRAQNRKVSITPELETDITHQSNLA